MNHWIEQFRALPRAARWGLVFVAFCAAYFGIIEPAMRWTSELSARADRFEAAIGELDTLTRPDSTQGRNTIGAMTNFGKPYLPGDPALRRESVYTAINDILRKHGVVSPATTERQANMRDDDARAILGVSGGMTDRSSSVLKLTLDIEFEAEPDVIHAVVADLEAAPEIVAVQRVRIDRPGSSGGTRADNGGRSHALRAEVVAEAWVPASPPPAPAAATRPTVPSSPVPTASQPEPSAEPVPAVESNPGTPSPDSSAQPTVEDSSEAPMIGAPIDNAHPSTSAVATDVFVCEYAARGRRVCMECAAA